MFQNKYVKKIKQEFVQNSNFVKGEFPFKKGYYKDVNNGKISIWFHRNSIEITFQFIDILPYEHHEKIFNLAVKEESNIHPKIKCYAIEQEFIAFKFTKQTLKEINYQDLINASNDLTEFCKNKIIHLVERLI